MRFWFAVLSALMLILSFSAGDAAVAAAVPCNQQSPEIIVHAEPTADEPADCPLTGTHHHHACSGHHVAAQPSDAAVEVAFRGPPAILVSALIPLSGRSPPSELRPPIA